MKKILFVLFGLIGVIVILQLYIYSYTENKFSVIFFDVGQGDSALVRFADGSKMLVDCGADKKVLAKLGQYLPFYDRTIDYLVISHFDLDHYGGCVDVLRRYKVLNVIHNGGKKQDEFYRSWQKYLLQEKAEEYIIDQAVRWNIASSTLEFVWPLGGIEKYSSNDSSIVFRLKNISTTILFTGDLEEKAEKALVQKMCSTGCSELQADILKVGHHGSGSSSGEEFLFSVKPTRAVVSVGKNRFGHPSQRIMNRLKRNNISILQTNIIGDIVVK